MAVGPALAVGSARRLDSSISIVGDRPPQAPAPARRASTASGALPPTTAAKAQDDAILVMLATMQPPLPAEEVARYRAEVKQAVSQMADLGYLDDPASFHVAPPAPALSEPPVVDETSSQREWVKLRFPSAYEPKQGLAGSKRYASYKKNLEVEANILRYTDQPRPWLIFLHGFSMGGDHDLIYGGAKKLQDALGVNIASVPFPFHGHRKLGTRSGERALSADVMDMINAHAQGLSDVRQLMRWIEAEQPGQPIAAYGVSMGGFDLGLLAGLEHLDLAIAVAPEFDLADRAIVPLAAKLGDDFIADAKEAMTPISQGALPALSSPSNLHVIGATSDKVTQADSAVKLADKLGGSLDWVDATHLSALGKAMGKIIDLVKTSGLSRPKPAALLTETH